MNLEANKRYGVLFDTRVGSDYFYDAGTGKVTSCSCEDVQVIKKILNGEVDVQTACELNREFGEFVRKENLFKCPEGTIIARGNHSHMLSMCPKYKELYDLQQAMGKEKE